MSNPETTETASDLLVSASVCVVGVLAEALAQHQLNNWWEVSKPDGKRVSCSCKWVHESDGLFGWESGRDARAIHRAHVASVVAALPNIAIVKLPEPAFQEDGTWEWCSGRSRNAVWINDDGLIEDRFGIGQEPEDVRMWAADLLAAAARAVGGQ